MIGFKRLCATLLFTAIVLQGGWAANTKESVEQVATSVNLTTDVDYRITSSQPFSGEGCVNIENTDHAVLIFERVKPSSVITLLANRVKINGETAQNDVNCQVRQYGSKGAIVLPHTLKDKPLTVFSEQNFGGESVNDFGLENDGGYMNTLTAEKLNNKIRSFKLKRGYMVTFSTQASGRGYSRCFIANNEDLEISELPTVLDKRISSYRLFKWNTVGKAGIANTTNKEVCKALNVVSCYSFGLGEDLGVDVECVPHHIYEDWPSSSACGKTTYSPHLKTNNEPGNSADDRPQSVETILNNWENLMRTGMRLCSPSSHDGSLNHLSEFMDSIDARGWRCDILDLHCYWLESTFSSIQSWVDKYHRPIWISEWVWGASWNKNGAFASGVTTAQVKSAVQNICTKLNSWDYIERYYYWNSEVWPSKIYQDGKLTPAGEWYAAQLTGNGYTSKYDFVPKNPKQYGFTDYKVSRNGNNVTISWRDYNGEYNQYMRIYRKLRGGNWEVLADITPEETGSTYKYVDENAPEGASYRLYLVDLNGKEYFSDEDVVAGDLIETDEGKKYYVGGNIIANGNFEMGTYGWLTGKGEPLSLPLFEVFPLGSTNRHFLQAFGHGGMTDGSSILTAFDIEKGQDYLVSMNCRNCGDYLKISLSEDGQKESLNPVTFASNSDWKTYSSIFNSGDYDKVLTALRWLTAKGQISKIEIRRLFTTREEAVADGIRQERNKAEHIKKYNTTLLTLNEELTNTLNLITEQEDDALAEAISANQSALEALRQKQAIDSLLTVCATVDTMDFAGKEALLDAMEEAKKAETASAIISSRENLQNALDNFIGMSVATGQPASADLSSKEGWQVKTGTFQGGDQRLATKVNKTCWNAWWSGQPASKGTGASMEIRQDISGLDAGIYTLQCKATTEHACLSDQHAFIINRNEEAVSPALTYDYLDIPGARNPWQTLTTTPIYIGENDTVTIGFRGTKQGATDLMWKEFGNKDSKGDFREGWWCATDFQLFYHPFFRYTVVPAVYRTICLPYTYNIPEGVKFYRIAGLTSDYKNICLEEVESVEAGYPYIYISEKERVDLYTSGEAAARPVTRETNNLRGYFKTIATAAIGTYVLKDDGEWYRVEGERAFIANYTAIISKCQGIPVLEDWTGAKMPIHGAEAEFETPDNIKNISVKDGDRKNGVYDLQGRPATSQDKGIVIIKNGKKARKYAF